MKKLFGTDGIRGVAGEFPLDEMTVQIIGASLARYFRTRLEREPRFVTGRDTRESGAWIESALHEGVRSGGAEAFSAGVITTPGTAFLTREFGYDAGIVISASHNSFQDNGIKIFLPTGHKSDEALERSIEADIHAGIGVKGETSEVDNSRVEEFHRAYIAHLKRTAGDLSLAEKKLVVDCANGAASEYAPSLFRDLGAEVVAIHDTPDGRNINEDCGSLHLEHLQAKVLETNADLGIAFDGDADRSLFVDGNGRVVDGDATLWILGQYLKSNGKLANSKVVATVMSNIGLEIAFKSKEIELHRANVGDKYVLEGLEKTGSEIGGEQSGHIIFPEVSLVGDGMMTAILVLRALDERSLSLAAATEGLTVFPQTLKNVRVSEKRPFDEVPEIAEAAAKLEGQLDGNGRLLLRYSGTENLARVMIEGRDQAVIEEQANELAQVIQKALG